MFGEYLVSRNLIQSSDLEDALAVQPISRRKLGRVLVELGFLEQERCDLALADFLGVKGDEDFVIYLSDKSAPPKIEILESGGSEAFLCLGSPNKLYLRSFSDLLVEKAEKIVGEFNVYVLNAEQWSLMLALSGPAPLGEKKSAPTIYDLPKSEAVTSTPYGDLLNSLLRSAKEIRASDIHFDSTFDGLSIRFRVNGELTTMKKIKRELAQSFLTEVKSQAGLPLTVIGSPCGGAAKFPSLNLKVRAQSNGQIHGETIVLRLIDEERTKNASIATIGSDELFESDLRKALSCNNGLILMCGQTGSGKSWTLYSLLMSIDREACKVITIEDPVEYEGIGLMQIEVAEGKISFQEALRSSLRLDPDVIMIGEVRDEETAELAFKAASTGHLVLSTLHTNGALEAIARLKGLGIDSEMIESNVRLISALTLRKKLCESCRIPVPPDGVTRYSEEAGAIAFGCEDTQFFTRNSNGCDAPGCHDGATGRILISESLSQTDLQGQREGLLVPGFRSLRQCILEYAATGIVGIEEVLNA